MAVATTIINTFTHANRHVVLIRNNDMSPPRLTLDSTSTLRIEVYVAYTSRCEDWLVRERYKYAYGASRG